MAADFKCATFGNGYYLVAGDCAVVLTALERVSRASRSAGATGGQELYGASLLGNRFDGDGAGGTILESDVVAPVLALQIQRQMGTSIITGLALPGSSFRIQDCTDLAAPTWLDSASFSDVQAITYRVNTSPGIQVNFYRAVFP